MVVNGFGGDGLTVVIAQMVLVLLRLTLFALALGLTLISFQSYRQVGSKRLESAFVGFAFISMGIAVSALNSQTATSISNPEGSAVFFVLQISETIPFIIGFAMLYVSLYR